VNGLVGRHLDRKDLFYHMVFHGVPLAWGDIRLSFGIQASVNGNGRV
jgi:hypothetical protein